MEQKLLKDLKKGEYFTLKPYDEPKESQVYVRGDYDRSMRRYEVISFCDINSFRYLSGLKTVYVGFTF